MKKVVVMYSGQLDSIAAICTYIENNPEDELFLLNIVSGCRFDCSDHILNNFKILQSKYKNIKTYKFTNRSDLFTKLSIIPLNFENNSLKGSSVCVGCLFNIFSQALLYAKKINAQRVIVGFRSSTISWEDDKSILFYILKKTKNIFSAHSVDLCFPIKHLVNKKDLLEIIFNSLGSIEIPKYNCVFKDIKKFDQPYHNHVPFLNKIFNLAFKGLESQKL